MNGKAARGDATMPMWRPIDDDGVEPEDGEPQDKVTDPLTGTIRVCSHRCDTCIFRATSCTCSPDASPPWSPVPGK